MTDIQKMIYEEAERYDKFSSIVQNKRAFVKGANFALSQLQHENRWRKVSEELPDIDDYLQHSVIAYLVKLDSGAYALAVYHADGIWLESGTEYELEVIEWKPIT